MFTASACNTSTFSYTSLPGVLKTDIFFVHCILPIKIDKYNYDVRFIWRERLNRQKFWDQQGFKPNILLSYHWTTGSPAEEWKQVHSYQLSFSYLQFVTHTILYYCSYQYDGFTSCLVANWPKLAPWWVIMCWLRCYTSYLLEWSSPPSQHDMQCSGSNIILFQSHMDGWF